MSSSLQSLFTKRQSKHKRKHGVLYLLGEKIPSLVTMTTMQRLMPPYCGRYAFILQLITIIKQFFFSIIETTIETKVVVQLNVCTLLWVKRDKCCSAGWNVQKNGSSTLLHFRPTSQRYTNVLGWSLKQDGTIHISSNCRSTNAKEHC